MDKSAGERASVGGLLGGGGRGERERGVWIGSGILIDQTRN
jgi:hypothetical protein